MLHEVGNTVSSGCLFNQPLLQVSETSIELALLNSATVFHFRSEFYPDYGTVSSMKQISVQDLKANLSAAISKAETGEAIVITRHNQPVAQLIPPHPTTVHRGASVGKGRIAPALKRGSKDRYLAILLEDRGDR
jgi:prevent-host-death family protein